MNKEDVKRYLVLIAKYWRLLRKGVGKVWRKINPLQFLSRLDRYIMAKFIGTYIYSIILIISIAIVFDVNENLSKFATNSAPLKAIVFDYYANFVPYFSNLFSPLFVFIAVIFFTSKLAGNSEIIAMLAAGVSFKRLMKPYMLSAALIAVVNFYLISNVIPHGTVIRQDFEAKYKNSKRTTSASNVQLMVGPGIIAYIQNYDNRTKTGYGFSLDKFENKKLVSHMTASTIRYDSISDTRFHWKANNYKIRKLKGLREEITTGVMLDTVIHMEPMDLVFSKGQQETLTSSELRQYISKQTERGSGNVVQYIWVSVWHSPSPISYCRRLVPPLPSMRIPRRYWLRGFPIFFILLLHISVIDKRLINEI